MAPRGSGAGERCRSCAGLAVHVVFVSGVSYINVFSFSVGSQLLCIKQIVKKCRIKLSASTNSEIVPRAGFVHQKFRKFSGAKVPRIKKLEKFLEPSSRASKT